MPQFTQKQMNKQGSAAAGQHQHSDVLRSAYTGHVPAPVSGGIASPLRSEPAYGAPLLPETGTEIDYAAREAEAQAFWDDAIKKYEYKQQLNTPEGFASGEGDLPDFASGLDPAIEAQNLSPELQSQVMGDIFGGAKAAAGFGALGGFGLANAAGFSTAEAVVDGSLMGASAAVASPITMGKTVLSGLAATGNLYGANKSANAMVQAALASGLTMEQINEMGIGKAAADADYFSKNTGLVSGLKGLYGAAKDAYTSGRSAEQAQGAFDADRAAQAAALDPAYGGGKFGTPEEAHAAALKDIHNAKGMGGAEIPGVSFTGYGIGDPGVDDFSGSTVNTAENDVSYSGIVGGRSEGNEGADMDAGDMGSEGGFGAGGWY